MTLRCSGQGLRASSNNGKRFLWHLMAFGPPLMTFNNSAVCDCLMTTLWGCHFFVIRCHSATIGSDCHSLPFNAIACNKNSRAEFLLGCFPIFYQLSLLGFLVIDLSRPAITAFIIVKVLSNNSSALFLGIQVFQALCFSASGAASTK